MTSPRGGSQAQGAHTCGPAPAQVHRALTELRRLAAEGRFAEADALLQGSDALAQGLPEGERRTIATLIQACRSCDGEALSHRQALDHAIERERELAQRLGDCVGRLFTACLRSA